MRHRISIVLVALSALVWAMVSTGRDRIIAAPPLSLDGYRDEKLPKGKDDSAALTEFNGACYVCHGNYRGESLVSSHAKERIGCVTCHGESLAHQADETHRTPPEKMYPAHDVDKMCAECHEEHAASAKKVLARWQQRCPAKTNPDQIVCTDCHYEHRLTARSVVWDKKTGKLLVLKKDRGAGNAKNK